MQQSKNSVIDLLLNSLGITQTEFAKKLGITSNGVTNMKGRQLSTKYIKRIIDLYPQVNTDFLMTGQGEVLKSCDIVTKIVDAPKGRTKDDMIDINEVYYIQNKPEKEFKSPDHTSDTIDVILEMFSKFVSQLEEDRSQLRKELKLVSELKAQLASELEDIKSLKGSLADAVTSLQAMKK